MTDGILPVSFPRGAARRGWRTSGSRRDRCRAPSPTYKRLRRTPAPRLDGRLWSRPQGWHRRCACAPRRFSGWSESPLRRTAAGRQGRQYAGYRPWHGRSPLFHVRKRGRLGREIEIAQISPVQNGIGLIRADVRQAEAGGFDRHQAAGQLDGGVASAALHIVGACARCLRNAGKVGKQLCMLFKNISFTPYRLLSTSAS